MPDKDKRKPTRKPKQTMKKRGSHAPTKAKQRKGKPRHQKKLKIIRSLLASGNLRFAEPDIADRRSLDLFDVS